MTRATLKRLQRALLTSCLSLGAIASIPLAARSEPLAASVTSAPWLEYASETAPSASNPGAIAEGVTSVSELSDVKPTDWAFTALQSLVERYGCIAGYPDKTYRGRQPLTRYEFAAGLNACLDKINEIISAGLAEKVSKDDLAALQKLQEEFAAELAAWRGRVDTLEAKAARLQSQQFSTTTKLEGQVIMAVTGGGSGQSELFLPALDAAGNSIPAQQPGSANTTVISRVRLNFNTTFTGDDLLLTRLETGNGGGGVADFLEQPFQFLGFTGFGNSSGLDYSGAGPEVSLNRLRYDFSPAPDVRVSIGTAMSLNDRLDANSFANDEASDFSSGMFINNPLILPVNEGAGAVIDWNPGGGAFSLRAGYVAANAANATAGDGVNRGLFGDPYQGTVEVEFAPKNADGEIPFALRLQYTRAAVNNLEYSIGGVNVEWAIAPGIGLFGRYGFGSLRNYAIVDCGCANAVPTDNISAALGGMVNGDRPGTTINPSTWSAGLAFPNLFKEGALAGVAIGQPFVEGSVGNATQTNLEAFYNFPVNEFISITPDLQLIFNPNNNSANNTIAVATLRAVFRF